MPLWRIFYDDGSTFSSDDGAPHEAPPTGFICAVGRDESGRRYIMHGWDFYRFDEASGQWWGHDVFGVVDWAIQSGHVVRVLPGAPTVFSTPRGDFDLYGLIEHLKSCGLFLARTVTKTEFSSIMRKAHEDLDFPRS